MTELTSRLLFISPSFFGYEQSIRTALEESGHQVDFIDERPSNSALARALVRLNPRLIGSMVDRHYRQALARFGAVRYQHIVLIKGEVVPEWFLRELRRRNSTATFTFYTFDSVSNSPNCLKLLPHFDRSYSFDYADVAANDALGYLPLFFAPEFDLDGQASAAASRPYELSFIGTLHSERYRAVNDLFRHFRSTYKFFYVQARWYYYFSRFVSRSMKDVRRQDVSFDKLSRREVAERFRQSQGVFDLQRTGQSGLTMRTFEVLASGAVLVTTNAQVRREPVFDPDWVVILENPADPHAAERVAAAMERRVEGCRAPGIEQYSLARWVDRLMAEG